eukprot:7578094-Lingulodinium_polyedra.AAC.1
MQQVAFCQGETLQSVQTSSKPSVLYIPGSQAAQQESSSDADYCWGDRMAWAKARPKAQAAPG